MSDANRKRILILGAGFGGLEAAKRLARLPVDVTVVDRQNHHLFQPLLYQVATAGLSAPEVAAPIRKVLGRYPNVRVVLDECVSVQLQQRQVTLKHSGLLDYDYLILAVGARTQYFGNDHYESFAPGLKSLDDATRIRHNVLLAFEEAERASDPEDIQRLTRIVVVGGGPTGVELAGAFAELSKRVLAKDFRNIDPHAS
ncbi:MAG: FAD-dependent oxidoreductase, partial [Puniceicoccaceae bacterium]